MEKENILNKGYTNSEWEVFIKGDVLAFMVQNRIENIVVKDGCGKQARVNRNASGEFKVNITSSETM